MATNDTKTNDPDLSALMRKKAETTPALELVEEIETLHAGLHEMKAQNFAMVLCLGKVTEQAQAIIEAEAKRSPGGHEITEPLARLAGLVVECLGRIKGII